MAWETTVVKGRATQDPKPGPLNQLRALLATWLETALRDGELNQTILAKEAHIGRETINALLRERKLPQDETILALAAALNIDPPTIAVVSDATDVASGGAGRPGERRSRTDRRAMAIPARSESLEAMKQQARLVHETLARVVEEHEVGGLDLRKVLGRMANGLDQLGHHEAATELYALVWKLSQLEVE